VHLFGFITKKLIYIYIYIYIYMCVCVCVCVCDYPRAMSLVEGVAEEVVGHGAQYTQPDGSSVIDKKDACFAQE